MAVVVVKKRKPQNEVFCYHCESTLLYEKEDVHIGYMGCEMVNCPECGHDIDITGERVMPPTFPQTFFHFGGGAKVSDEDTQEMVNKAVDNIKTSRVGEFYNMATGDTAVIALKYEDCIDIIVAKNYWEDTLTNED